MAVKSNWQNGEQFNATDANTLATAVNSAYVKPGLGVPITDLTATVQASLGKADSAVQSVAAASITDSTTTGRAVLTAADAAAARTTLGVAYGTTSTTVAVGNDSRFSPSSTSITDSTATGRALLTTTDASAARTTLGVAYGTSSTTVAVGNDARITGAQQASEKGQANGYASLDNGGKVPITQLPSSIMEYQGTWNASTNSPTLSDGTGSTGDVYRVSVGGARNLGSGSITFDVGDYVIYNGTIWQKSDTTDAVSTVAGRTGDVTLTVADIGGNTTTALGVGSVELGHASDTTLTRSAAGILAVEGVDQVNLSSTQTLSNKTVFPGVTSTATAATTTALTIASTQVQVFTGSTTQTVTLPTTSVTAGSSFTVINNSSGVVTVQSSGANTVLAMAGSTAAVFTALVATPTTAAHWAYTNVGTGAGQVADVSIVGFGASTARAVGTGDFPFGVKLQRAITFTSVTFRAATADASGNLVVELRKNGSQVSGTPTTIAAASQVAGGTTTGTWSFAAGDIITVQVTAVGTTPGKGLIADIKGVTA